MTWTDPVPYPNSLEQNDPEGALNAYVIENLKYLYANSGGTSDIVLIASTFGTGEVSSPLIMHDVFSSAYTNYRFVVDWWTTSSVGSADKGKLYWATGASTYDAGGWVGQTYIGTNSMPFAVDPLSNPYINLSMQALGGNYANGYGSAEIPNRTVINLNFTSTSFNGNAANIELKTQGFDDYSTYEFKTSRTMAFGNASLPVTGLAFGGEFHDINVSVSVYGINTTLPA